MIDGGGLVATYRVEPAAPLGDDEVFFMRACRSHHCPRATIHTLESLGSAAPRSEPGGAQQLSLLAS